MIGLGSDKKSNQNIDADSCDVPFINLSVFFFSFSFINLSVFWKVSHDRSRVNETCLKKTFSICDDWKREHGFSQQTKITKLQVNMFTHLCFECFKKSFSAPISQTVCRQNASDFFAFKNFVAFFKHRILGCFDRQNFWYS